MLCLMDASTASMNTSLRVLASYMPATLRNFANRSFAYCCGSRWTAEYSTEWLHHSSRFPDQLNVSSTGNSSLLRKSVIAFQNLFLRYARIRQMVVKCLPQTCDCSTNSRLSLLHSGEVPTWLSFCGLCKCRRQVGTMPKIR